MSHELACSWLGLPADCWPPDHYALLGLQPGEVDVARIEQQVHERMERVRRYQLTHPEVATDAMNRLAQALICLTDPTTRKNYDAGLAAARTKSASQPAPILVPARPAEDVPKAAPVPIVPAFPVAGPQTQLNWQTSPPPLRSRTEIDTITVPQELAQTKDNTPALPAEPARNGTALPTVPSPAPPDQAQELARLSSSARRGLGTKRALYYRIAKTRQLLWVWERIGKYLRDPQRDLARPAEGEDLGCQLRTVQDLLRTFPPLLGDIGQPGYYVMALARQPMIASTLQTLVPSQREKLATDWGDGQKLLLAHRQFLRDELRALRRRSSLARVIRTMRVLLADNPGTLLVVLAVIALNLAYPPLLRRWPEQMVVLAGLAALRVYLWWDTLEQLRPVRLITTPSAIRPQRRPRPQRQAQ